MRNGFRGLLAGQLGCNHSNSVDGTENILGESIESAMAVIRTAKYQRENPSPGDWTIDPSEWEKEKKFYNAFLDKLEKLRNGEINYEGRTVFGEFITHNPIKPEGDSQSISELPNNEFNQSIIDQTKRTDIDGVEYEMLAAYSADSTPQDPILEVKLIYDNQEKIYQVRINDVDMEKGSQVEQFALLAYAGDSEGIVHRYPPKGANVPNVLFKPNMEKMLALYGLTQIPWESQLEKDEESWWEKRIKLHKLYLKQAQAWQDKSENLKLEQSAKATTSAIAGKGVSQIADGQLNALDDMAKVSPAAAFLMMMAMEMNEN